MFEKIKNLFITKKSFVKDGIRYNPNNCWYCGEIIGKGRFYFKYGKYFHKRCNKKYIKNGKKSLVYE
jgi:hypothetical protein